MNCINKYCDWSGQNLNTSKFGVFFSKHTPQPSRKAVKHILQMKSFKKDAIYLGSPMFLSNKSPSKDFKYLIDKLETRLMGWRSKTLSWARRSTLITSIAQAIPSYAMSSFSITSKVYDRLDALSCRFWWNPKQTEGSFLALTAWENLCRPKCMGGFGFKRAKDVNNALLAKFAWMIASKRDSLCMSILRAK